jgi:hypothetical protein
MVKRIAAALVCAALLAGVSRPAPVLAQGGTPGRMSGVVTDSSSGQPLQSVQIFLSQGTTRLEARTAADGRYTFVNVPAGNYSLEAIRLGYRRVVRANIGISAGGALTYDFRMDVAPLNLQAIVTTGVVDPTSGTRVPFSVGRVSAEDAPVPATNALETIQGKIAGVSGVRRAAAPTSSCARRRPSARAIRHSSWWTASSRRPRSTRRAPTCSRWISRAWKW